MGEISIAGVNIESGSRKVVKIPVTKDLSGDVNIYTHILTGEKNGPTLLLLSMLHGNEWFSVLILKELLKRIDVSELKGNIIAVPVANQVAFGTASRTIIDDSDEPDANRAFDGKYNWLTNQITRVIEEELFSKTDYLIDYHIGDWGCTMADIGYGMDYDDPKISEISKGMALSYGFPMIHSMSLSSRGTHSARTSMGSAGIKYNIPAIVPEIGGLGFGEVQEKEWLEQNIQGLIGTMKYIGMLEGSVDYCKEYLFINDYWRVSPKNAGYIEPLFGLERQFTEVEKEEVLAKVIDPYTFDVLEELVSPGKGIIFYMCRAYMSRPGGWAFGIANLEDGKSTWEKI
ncbi:succinylglutamate desuccinylase/aspartoacylase family protein [Ornithinibacillus californiensis]|uniref:succinylglutamate desuccinylase/aspartoacylase family protein n=1 Tax=Ornithinibacillus californiensis TaxID=161536 RepID=UPI00064DFE68|nr:succinylglutamate desuccinylase/aspartoacylase family protein [Ornithinibacillus californiensis]